MRSDDEWNEIEADLEARAAEDFGEVDEWPDERHRAEVLSNAEAFRRAVEAEAQASWQEPERRPLAYHLGRAVVRASAVLAVVVLLGILTLAGVGAYAIIIGAVQ